MFIPVNLCSVWYYVNSFRIFGSEALMLIEVHIEAHMLSMFCYYTSEAVTNSFIFTCIFPSALQVVNAAVIVDPSVKQVIASACDESCCWNTPTNKTSIRPCSLKQPEDCISHPDSNIVVTHDSLLSNGSTTKLEQLCTGVSCLYPWQWSEKQPHTPNSCYWHPLRHAALVAIESSAARDRKLFSGLGDNEDKSSELDHMQSSFTSSPAKRQKINLKNVSYFSLSLDWKTLYWAILGSVE